MEPLTTTLCSWGTSRAVRIPKRICEEMGMNIGSALDMVAERDDRGPYIVLRPRDTSHRSNGDLPFRSMNDLFKGYEGSFVPQELDWGEDVGGERCL